MAVPKWDLREGEAPAEPAFATCADRPDVSSAAPARLRPGPTARDPGALEPEPAGRGSQSSVRNRFDPFVPPKSGRHFAAVRRDLRAYIAESEAGRDVESLVEELLS